ncbi:MAG: GNAT family N-acetyltransferase [Candidatus Pacebacteria bacterium]|jgi:GNAT superfamily N-acetyltransferase|nr:GNAT family N-acetyltransferase [Candidatus Paceibacterota bacterium]
MSIRRVVVEDYGILKDLAVNVLEPLYGDQSKSLREWFTGDGYKHAFVLDSEHGIAGFLSLKINPNKPYLKISTLFVFDGHKRLGCGKKLLAKAVRVAKDLGYHRLVVTVSDKKPEAMDFFLHSGFSIIDKKPGKYRPDSTEFILDMAIF